jgi:phosphate-selective porin OprO/OprP
VRFQGDFAGFMQDTTHAGVATSGVCTVPGGYTPPPTACPAAQPWTGPGDLSSGAVFRRAYIGVEGRAFKDFWYELRLNAGGSDGGNAGASGVPNAGEGDPLLNKAVITYTGIDHFHLNVGVLEPNFMFEGTTSSAWLTFLERPEIDNIAADSFGAGDSRRGIEANWQKTDTLWPATIST